MASLQEQAKFGQQLAREQFDWAKTEYAKNRGQIDPIIQNFQRSQDFNQRNAEEDRQRYKDVYQPVEDRQVQDAMTFDSADNMERRRGMAMAGVAQGFEAARQNTMRDLESYGINPGAVRYAGLDAGIRAQQGASEAAAGTMSDLNTENAARSLRQGAIQVGQTYPGQVIGESGAAMNAGSGAVNAALNTTASGSSTMGTPTAWYAGGNQAFGSAADTMNASYKNRLAAYEAEKNNSTGFGTALGAGLGAVKMFAAEGGEVPMGASPTHGRAIDDVPAKLTAGEFVIPKDVTSWYGEDKLHKLIQKARQDRAGGKPKPQKNQAMSFANFSRAA
jgi:hypothetical protein